jgi:arylsulfatase A-like enzyme/Tfp pilus assembly protein PilF
MMRTTRIALVACLAAATWAACARRAAVRPIEPGALRGANLLLVTIDTLRADHVGAYGSARGATPTLDRLAREGLRFDEVRAHVPLTLPSHTTIMTGLYPMANGVHDNGSFRFNGSHPTLAGALRRAGYHTGAFVGAFPVDARFGLNVGFDVYDDNYGSRPAGGELSQLERPAEQVLAPALNWIRAQSRPWFAWVHLYDPHDPYAPPEPYRSRYASDLYSGEIAYADAALAGALGQLAEAGMLDRTLVCIASDHGESLGEHGERTHGLFAYDATLRVPWILWAPFAIDPGVIRRPARLVDLMPTVLDLLGVETHASLDGRSLRPFIGTAAGTNKATDEDGSYFEALNANLTRNWAPLTGIVTHGMKLIDLPIPELYDLSADPHEQHNLYARRREAAAPLEHELDALVTHGAVATPSRVDPDTEQRLRSLGYVVAPVDRRARTFTGRDDPKTLIDLQNQLDAALDALKNGDAARSEANLKALVSARPDFTIARERLAFLYHETGRLPAAIDALETASKVGAPDAEVLATLGGYLQEANELDRSAATLELATKINPDEIDAYEKLGITYTRMRRFDAAERQFRRVLTVDPTSPTTYNNLGSMFLTANRNHEAIEALSKAVQLDPALANAHNGLGVAYARIGELPRAIEEWRKALAIRPDFADARENLSRVGVEQ